ncbi:hypothetical protein [Dokdonia sp.]|uniref:hypothetical protein n=1 Tax=Dokdonia sp. TaxID=2024995 RepID=UPI003263A752
MENLQFTISLKNTEETSLIHLRNELTTIYCKEYENHQNKNTHAPIEQIDIVVDIADTPYDDQALAAKIHEQLFYVKQEIHAKGYNKQIQAQEEKAIVTLINNPMLIEILMIHEDIIKKTYRGKDRKAFAIFFNNVINNLINNEKSAYDILDTSEKKYKHIIKHVRATHPNYVIHKHEKRGFRDESRYYTEEKGFEKAMTLLGKAIDILYLTRKNPINEVNTFWYKLKRDLRKKVISIHDLLEDQNYQELRAYIYKEKEVTYSKVNIEQYRPEILKQIQQALRYSKFRLKEINSYKETTPTLRNERRDTKIRIKEYKAILSLLENRNKYPLVDILNKHLIIFFFFTIEGPTEAELTDEKLYPKLSHVYKKYMKSWIYGKKQKTIDPIELDEIVITGLGLYKPTFGNPYYRITTGKIYGFLKENVGEIITLKEHFRYGTKHKVKFALDLGVYKEHLPELRFRQLFKNKKLIKESTFDLSCIDAEIKIKEVTERIGRRGTKKTVRPCFYIYIKNTLGDVLLVLETMRPQTFERIVKDLQVNVSAQNIKELNAFFRENIQKYRANRTGYNEEMLAFFYKYLPESTYKNEQGRRVIFDDDDDGNIKNDKIGDREIGFTFEELKEDLEVLLDSWRVGDGKEKAIVSILMAMPPEEAYKYLYNDTATLKLLVDAIDGDNFHKLFVQYVAFLIDQFGYKQPRTIWFGNDTWFPEIQLDGSWDGGDSFTLSNFTQSSITPWFEYGERTDINLEEVPYHPMDLVAMSTVIDNEVIDPIYVPAFYIAKKIQLKSNWDFFTIALDVISLISLQASARFILKAALKKAGNRIAKREAIKLALNAANVLKETSSFAIRSETLRKAMDPDVYRAWRMLDTAGDLIYLGVGIRSLKNLNIFKAKPKALEGLDGLGGGRTLLGNTADLAEANHRYAKLKQFLEASKKAIKQFKEAGEEIPAKLKAKLLALEKELNDFIDQVGLLPPNQQRLVLEGVDGSRVRVNLFDDAADGSRKLNIDAPSGSGSGKKVSNQVEEINPLQKKYNLETPTEKQLDYFKALDKLGITDQKIIKQLIQAGKKFPKKLGTFTRLLGKLEGADPTIKQLVLKLALQNNNIKSLIKFSPEQLKHLGEGLLPNARFGNAADTGAFINKPKNFNQVTPEDLEVFLRIMNKAGSVKKGKGLFKKFDLNVLRGKELKITRIEKTIRILEEKGYKHLVKLAKRTRNYQTIHDNGLKAFIKKATDAEFDEYLNIFRIDGKVGNAFMPYYKQLGEGLENLRKTTKSKIDEVAKAGGDVSKVKVNAKALKEVMKGYERHHQIMISIMQKNPTFQKIMDWALQQTPPLDLGFNDFRKNIIILVKEQHGYHNLRTEIIQEMVSDIEKVFDNGLESITNKIGGLDNIISVGGNKNFRKAYNRLEKIIEQETKIIIEKVIQIQNSSLDKISKK